MVDDKGKFTLSGPRDARSMMDDASLVVTNEKINRGYRKEVEKAAEELALVEAEHGTAALLFDIHSRVTPDVQFSQRPAVAQREMAFDAHLEAAMIWLAGRKDPEKDAKDLFAAAEKEPVLRNIMSSPLALLYTSPHVLSRVLYGGNIYDATEKAIPGKLTATMEPIFRGNIAQAGYTVREGKQLPLYLLRTYGVPGTHFDQIYEMIYGFPNPMGLVYVAPTAGLDSLFAQGVAAYEQLPDHTPEGKPDLAKEAMMQLVMSGLEHPFIDRNGTTFLLQLGMGLKRRGINIDFAEDLPKIIDEVRTLTYVSMMIASAAAKPELRYSRVQTVIKTLGLTPMQLAILNGTVYEGDNIRNFEYQTPSIFGGDQVRLKFDLHFRMMYMQNIKNFVGMVINRIANGELESIDETDLPQDQDDIIRQVVSRDYNPKTRMKDMSTEVLKLVKRARVMMESLLH